MNRKLLWISIALVLILILGLSISIIIKKNENKSDNDISQNTQAPSRDDLGNKERSSLVLYFSATGTTKDIAKKIAQASNSDITEIIPKEKYTSEDLSYTNDNCRANKEQKNDKARPEIANKINIKGYKTIYLGFPIWWGTNPKIILTLLDNYDLSNKNIILFSTSGGSGIDQSLSDLKKYNNNLNIIASKRFSNGETEKNIETWLKTIN